MHRSQPRVRYIDGLRGIAILAVLVYHYFGPTYVAVLPYGGRFARFPVAHYGWAGVYLFFLISGYVIFATLERCASYRDFLWRRWVRLFPAMAITTVPVFLVSHAASLAEVGGTLTPFSLLPGLTFVSPAFFHAATHHLVDSVDGVYWTLYAEVAFYLVFGFLYFRTGARAATAALVGLGVLVRWGPDLIAAAGITGPMRRVLEPLGWERLDLFPWFASGILFYRARGAPIGRTFALALLVGLLAAAATPSIHDWGDAAALLLVLVLFAGAQRWTGLQRVLEWRGLLIVGFVSYPLYLLHNDLGLIALHTLGQVVPASTVAVAAIGVAAVLMALAWVVARFAEPWMRGWLLRLAPRAVRRDRPVSAGSAASP